METQELGQEAVADAQRRLRKVEGQVRGLQRMIDEGRDCEEVLRQISAAAKALRRVGVNLAVTGLEHCLTEGEHDEPGTVDRFRKSFLELA
jgi:CsoR family transcriptional regulator, copper-sensing transcriptional repressor